MTSKCLIVGGNSGIGQAFHEVLSSMPIEIFRPQKNELDVRNPMHIGRYINLYGPFNYIVYSAGVNELCWVNDVAIMDISEETFLVNTLGFISLVSQHEIAFPETAVSAVAVSSDAADVPMRGSTAYCVSKAALNMAIKTMARELAPRWRINGVAPGMVEGTEMTAYIDKMIPKFRGWTPEYAREYERSSVPTGRRATLEEVAETILWALTGPLQMTGTIIKINGGKA